MMTQPNPWLPQADADDVRSTLLGVLPGVGLVMCADDDDFLQHAHLFCSTLIFCTVGHVHEKEDGRDTFLGVMWELANAVVETVPEGVTEMHDVDGDTESVKAMHGTVHYEAVHGFLECAARRDVRSAVNVISALWPDGNGLGVLVQLTANILESLAFTRHVNREGAL